MEIIRFVFWEAVKVLALLILGLMSSKGVAALSLRKGWPKPALYVLILALAGVGAWEVGNDVAAEVYLWSCNGNLSHGELDKAYSNSLQAVHLRPNNLSYWRALVQTNIRLGQLQSALDDEAAVRVLSNGDMDEVDEYQFALCRYALGDNDKVVAATLRLIRENPSYAAPTCCRALLTSRKRNIPRRSRASWPCCRSFPTIKRPSRAWRAPIT